MVDQTLSNQAKVSLTLAGSDPSGSALTYSAAAEPLNYWLDHTYGLYEDASGYNTGEQGAAEKYLRGKVSANGYNTDGQDPWYYLLPDGDLYELAPPYSATLTGSLVAILGPAVYSDPTLLTAATDSPIPAALTIANNVVTLAPGAGYTGAFEVIASVCDGIASASQPFRVTVVQEPTRAPTITWSNPADFIAGTPLGEAQLDATASVPGIFTYSPTAGTVFGTGPNQPLTVTFTPNDTQDYSVATGSTTISVMALPAPPYVTGIVSVSQTKKGLTAITVGFDEPMDSESVGNRALYSVFGAVKKHKKTVYTKGVGIKDITFDGNTRVTINFAKPYKGAVKLTVLGGTLAADGASGNVDFSAVVD